MKKFLKGRGSVSPQGEGGGKKFRLLRYFSIASFVAMAITAAVMGMFVREVETSNILAMGEGQNVGLSRAFANSLWPSLEGYLRQTADIAPEEVRNHPLVPYLNRMFGNLMRNLGVVKIKIYNIRGMCVYSTTPSQIGEDQGSNIGVRAALGGEMASNLVHRNAFPSYDGVVEDRDLISTYVPLTRQETVHGVFELYYDITPIFQRMEATQRHVTAGVVMLFLLLYGALFGVVRRADIGIQEQQNQLQEYLDRIRESNETLEERVRERTVKLTAANHALEEHIAQRVRTEQELRKLTRAVEQSPVSVVITDTMGRIEYVNPKFCAISGYTAEEVLGKNPSILKSGETSPEDYSQLWSTIRSGQEWRGEFHNRRKNGELYWELASISPIRNRVGRIIHYVSVKEDITDRKRADESLRKSEMQLRTIMANVVEGIITVNEAGIIETVNPAAEQIFGYTEAELAGRNISILVPFPHHLRHDDYIRKYLSSPERKQIFVNRELQATRKDGTPFPLEISINDVPLGGKPLFIATLRDISERKRAQQELEQTRQKYFQQEKMAAVGSLAAGIVHEIGNPIAAISGLLEEFRDSCDNMDSERTAILEMMQDNIARLANIVQDVSGFSMPQNEEFQLLDLNGLVEETCRLMRFDRRMRHVGCRMELDRALPAVNGSGTKLRQVLINLLINAADAVEPVIGERKPEVTLTTTLEENRVHLVVEDNGAGMDSATMAHAFDAFFTTKPVGKGTGLGLALCYSLIGEHGGVIELESTPGQGTRVNIWLPLGDDEVT